LVITNQRDTVFGKMRFGTPASRSARIVFRPSDGKKRIKYRPFQIYGYWARDDFYVSKIYTIHPSLSYGLGVYMKEVLIDGPIKLYAYWNTDRDRGFTQYFLEQADGTQVLIRRIGFKDQMRQVFQANPKIDSMLEGRRYKLSHITELVNTHNSWLKKQ